MSRCFPFPPPGYENKPRNHHVDLLAKEKHKEKKHKKEKRDREKRESKEGKGKDRNKERHQEKKDRKDKDKKRVKDRISDDGRIGGQTQGHNEQKLGVNNWKADEIKDSEFAEELDWRIQEEKGAAYRMFENFTGSIQSRVEDLEPSTAIKKERTKGNKMAAVVSSAKQSSNNGLGQPVENHVDKEIGKEKAKDEETDDRKDHRYKDRDSEEKRNKGKDSAKQSSNNGLGQPIENHVDKEKAKDEETDDRKDHRYKDRDSREKRNKGKDSDRHKEKEKEKEKVSRKGDTKHKENNTSKESGKKDMVDSSNFKPLAPHKDDVKFIGDGNNNKKRKDYEMNGFLHESDVRPNKFPRLVSSSHPPVENGRTIESCHIAAAHASIGHGAKNNSKAERGLDNKGHKINGTPGAQPTSIDLRPAVNTRQNGGAPLKPPHPDFKYLSQIYRIPKLEEWPESDDQEWLFGGHNARPNLKASFEADETPLVWAKVLQIESADVVALPYVIPY